MGNSLVGTALVVLLSTSFAATLFSSLAFVCFNKISKGDQSKKSIMYVCLFTSLVSILLLICQAIVLINKIGGRCGIQV